jgi:hypothetical protein
VDSCWLVEQVGRRGCCCFVREVGEDQNLLSMHAFARESMQPPHRVCVLVDAAPDLQCMHAELCEACFWLV